ncbi:MAG: hypothetical protein V3V01_04005 [Acidimicrobiales bacterium]
MTTIEEAFIKFGPELLRHATVLVGSDDAADLVSDAIVGAIASPGWSSASSQLGYLHRSVLNAARSRHRSIIRRASRPSRRRRRTLISVAVALSVIIGGVAWVVIGSDTERTITASETILPESDEPVSDAIEVAELGRTYRYELTNLFGDSAETTAEGQVDLDESCKTHCG